MDSVAASPMKVTAVNGNVLTLLNPYHGPTLPAGTLVCRREAGGWYQYQLFSGAAIPQIWTQFSTTFNYMRPGTESVRLLDLLYSGSTKVTGHEIWEGTAAQRPNLYYTLNGSSSVYTQTPVAGPVKVTLDGNSQGIINLGQRGANYIDSPVVQRTITFKVATPQGLGGPVVDPISTGLVGEWHFDESAGTTVADGSGNGNNGTLVNGAARAAGVLGGAMSFDGVDDYVQVGAQANLVMTTAATLSAWVNPMGSGGGLILNKEGEYEIGVFNGTLQWAFQNSSPGWTWIDTGFAVPAGQWTHVAVVYDHGVIRSYGNGALVHTYNGTGSIGDNTPTQNDFRIGGRQAGVQYFSGRVDEVRVYNRVISGAEIAGLAGVTPQITPTLNSGGMQVTIAPITATAGASIYYTTDGTDPTPSSTLYTAGSSGASIAATTTTKWKGFKDSYTPSDTVTVLGVPTFSPPGGTFSSGQSVTITAPVGAQLKVFQPGINLLNPGSWINGTSGSQGAFSAIGQAGEDSIETRRTPYGTAEPIWVAKNLDNTTGNSYDADGGWNAPIQIDHTKLYRFSVWVRKLDDTPQTTSGYTYLGCGSYGWANVSTLTGTATDNTELNPYFWNGFLPPNEWHLLVGYVHPAGDTGTVSSTKVYNAAGQVIFTGTDFRWLPTATSSYQRTYLY